MIKNRRYVLTVNLSSPFLEVIVQTNTFSQGYLLTTIKKLVEHLHIFPCSLLHYFVVKTP